MQLSYYSKQILYLILICLSSIFSLVASAQKKKTDLHTQVLIIGGTASGISAGIQSARLGVNTVIVESTPWLGGMLTSAGVGAFDGNHQLPSGLFGEFREQLYRTYGGPEKVSTGWVSNTLFEPHVGDSIFKKMASNEKKLTVFYSYAFEKLIISKDKIKGAYFVDTVTKHGLTILADRIIDATELGDGLASAGLPYDLGMESSELTGEDVHVPASNNIIQDITYVGILKDYGKPQPLIQRPSQYDSTEFDGSNTNFYRDLLRKKPGVDAQKMLDYGRMPNNKFMLNWPIYGNDIYLNIIEQTRQEREKILVAAKEQTLRFVYFIQKELQMRNLALADDEFPTKDLLAFYPYHRESRRLKGLVRMNVKHISSPYTTKDALYRTGIAVGDYPIDHHHKKNAVAPQHLDFYPVPSFNIPLGALIPAKYSNFIVAEKSISVSNIVNGTTRLQPCVLQIGQAAGTLAAISVKTGKAVQDVSIRKVQASLLDAGVYIMPFIDVPNDHPHFIAAQKIGAIGLLRGRGVPVGWANQTYFDPMMQVEGKLFLSIWNSYFPKYSSASDSLSIKEAIDLLGLLNNAGFEKNQNFIKGKWKNWNFDFFDTARPVKKIELAAILNSYSPLFESSQVNHQGIQTYRSLDKSVNIQ
jgi:hypothetical protein